MITHIDSITSDIIKDKVFGFWAANFELSLICWWFSKQFLMNIDFRAYISNCYDSDLCFFLSIFRLFKCQHMRPFFELDVLSTAYSSTSVSGEEGGGCDELKMLLLVLFKIWPQFFSVLSPCIKISLNKRNVRAQISNNINPHYDTIISESEVFILIHMFYKLTQDKNK